MDKILIEVSLPAADRSFEIYIPLDQKFYEVTLIISKLIGELSNGMFICDDDAVLCEKSTGHILNIDMSARELKLKNGAKLILL